MGAAGGGLRMRRERGQQSGSVVEVEEDEKVIGGRRERVESDGRLSRECLLTRARYPGHANKQPLRRRRGLVFLCAQPSVSLDNPTSQLPSCSVFLVLFFVGRSMVGITHAMFF